MKILRAVQFCLGGLVTLVLSLSLHVVMLEVLHIPYPDNAPSTGWAVYSNYLLGVAATFYFYRLSFRSFSSFSFPSRCLRVFVLLAMLDESLIRAPLMNGIVTSAWGYSVVQNLPAVLPHLLLACLMVLTMPRLPRIRQQLPVAFSGAAALFFVCEPLIRRQILIVLSWLPQPRLADAIVPPYGLKVLVPAYVTFFEPVLACFLLAGLVWHRLSAAPVKRLGQFTLLYMLMRGALLRPFIYMFYAKLPPVTAFLSMSQFSFEVAALAVLTAITFQICGFGRARATERKLISI